MTNGPGPRSAPRLEHWTHLVLLGGTVVSAILLVVGLALAAAGQGAVLHLHPSGPSAWDVFSHAQDADPATIALELGLLALAATPVVRVAVLGIGWSRQGEPRFAAVAFTVLALLVLSVVLGVR